VVLAPATVVNVSEYEPPLVTRTVYVAVGAAPPTGVMVKVPPVVHPAVAEATCAFTPALMKILGVLPHFGEILSGLAKIYSQVFLLLVAASVHASVTLTICSNSPQVYVIVPAVAVYVPLAGIGPTQAVIVPAPVVCPVGLVL